MTRKAYSRISFFIYLAFTLLAFGFATYFFVLFITTPATGWEGLGKAFALIFALICILYGLVTLIPTILKRLDMRFEKKGLTITCMIFDILLAFANLFLVISGLSGEVEIPLGIIGIVLTLLSVASFVANILCLKAKN